MVTIVKRSLSFSFLGTLLILMDSDVARQSQSADWIHIFHVNAWKQDFSGYVASALVLATFSARSMRQLRTTAIASNVAFIIYAIVGHLYPILILHGLLLPLNAVRLAEDLGVFRRIVRDRSLESWPCPST